MIEIDNAIEILKNYSSFDKLSAPEVVEFLINILGEKVNDFTLMLLAIGYNREDVMDYLYTNGLYKESSIINIRDEKGYNLMHFAALGGKVEAIKWLKNHGFNFYDQDNNGNTLMHMAAGEGHIDTIIYLKEQDKTLLDVKNKLGKTPMIYAVVGEVIESIKCLVKLGADINAKDNDNIGITALGYAVIEGTVKSIECLVNLGVDINAKASNDSTPLEIAIHLGKREVIECLVRLGAKVNTSNEFGLGPIFSAVCEENIEIIEFLVSLGADVNAKAVNGGTPIIFAADKGNIELMKYLKSIGAKLDINDYDGRTLIDYANQNGHIEAAEWLKANGVLDAKKVSEKWKNTDFTLLKPVDFMQGFLYLLQDFDNSCKEIHNQAEKNTEKIKETHVNELIKMEEEKNRIVNELTTKEQDYEHIKSLVDEKKKIFNEYQTKLIKLAKNDEPRRQTVYQKMTEIKYSEKGSADDKKNEVERIRRVDLFANEKNIKKGHDAIWQEYQNNCAKIPELFESQQSKKNNEISQIINKIINKNKEISEKKVKQAEEFAAFETNSKANTENKINAEINAFKSKFNPVIVKEEYASIKAADPLPENYQHGKVENNPKNIHVGQLSYGLTALTLGGDALSMLESYPQLFMNNKLYLPYGINVSETNGVCFLQTNDNREAVYKTIQSFILKLILQLKPGLLKLTLYDGVGSGKNLIGLSHIDKRIKGENILADTNELKRALETAVLDMNATIQKVLGFRYADKTLMDYNETAEKQEPYHIICLTDFPNGLGKDHLELITKIVRSGKQAGVFMVICSDTEYSPKNSYDRLDVSPLQSEMSVIEVNSLKMNFDLHLDSYFPDTDKLEKIQEHINAELKKSSKVEVKLDRHISEDKLWQSDSRNGIETPIGQLNVTDLQYFTLSIEDGSSDVPHHCLIGGATGSGKTVLLHNIICNTAWNYSPDEVQFILLDYKEGTEFKVYENLPHAKVLSIHSEREYGISVLEFINAEIERRGKKFKEVNAQNIAKYRENTGEKMPRLMIIIDEFQKLLDGDMRTTNFVSASLDDIGRRGRSFGINLILSSQSLSGVDINQALSHLGLRICLKLNAERDCDYFLGQGNHAPFKSLQKKGEAIYNARSGLTEGNVRFQVAYLSDKDIGEKIAVLQKRTVEKYGSDKPFQRFLYDGNVSASIEDNKNIPGAYTPDHRRCKVYIGEPVALEEEHSFYSLLRQNESNVLVVGQDILAAMSIFNHSIQQIVPQSLEESRVYICNKVNMDSDYYGKLDSLPENFPNVSILENDSEIQKTIEAVFEEVEKRKEESNKNRIILVFADIYNMRPLRKIGYADSPLAQKLVTILKDGPGFGVHCIVHASSFENLKNILDVHSMLNEFNVRIELRGGEGYKIFQSNDVGVDKATPDNWNIANLQTSQMNGIRKIKVYGL